MAEPFPDSPFFRGPEAPGRFECELYDCIVYGKIPKEIDGTWYRVVPDSQYAPKYADDVFINGDGMVDAFRIRNGHVDFKHRYVRTQKFITERAARKSVFGKYRNRWTDEEEVRWMIHATANTHVVYYDGVLLALKEDSKPYALDPTSLKTLGPFDFRGQYMSPTHTAHPKVNYATGEYVTYGFEAKGDASTDICYSVFDKECRKIEEAWFTAPWSGMIHDCIISENWICFVLLPLCTSMDRLRAGEKHYAWDETLPMTLGLFPRRGGKSQDIRWYPYIPQTFIGHLGNAFDVDEHVVCIDTPLDNGNVFRAFFPTVDGIDTGPKRVSSQYVRFTIDTRNPTGTRLKDPEVLVDVDGGMPRMDDRFVGKPYRYMLLSVKQTQQRLRVNVELGKDEGGVAGSGFANCIGRVDVKTGVCKMWWAGPMSGVSEQVFVPRSTDAPEGDGYILASVGRFGKSQTELVILDSRDFDTADKDDDVKPIARIVLPFRLRSGIHGSWVPQEVMGEWKQLCDMEGVDNETLQQFGDSCYHGTGEAPIPGHEDKRKNHLGGSEEGHMEGATVIRGPSSGIQFGRLSTGSTNGINPVVIGVNGTNGI